MSALGLGGHSAANPQDAQAHQNVIGSLTKMLADPSSGGLSGLLEKLKAGGLGSAVQSWVGTGANQKVSPDQVRDALGEDHVQEIARDAGVSADKASGGLAALLPSLVDKLTPGGKLPDQSSLSGMIGMLKDQLTRQPPA
jgi:uncharacterized protein YidB (DUF937 family)